MENLLAPTRILTMLEISTYGGQDERTHCLMLGAVRKAGVMRIVLSLKDTSKITVAAIAVEVRLTRGVNSHDPGPYEDEDRAEVLTTGLKKLRYVRENTNGKGKGDGPGSKINELRKEDKSAETMRLREEDLKDDR